LGKAPLKIGPTQKGIIAALLCVALWLGLQDRWSSQYSSQTAQQPRADSASQSGQQNKNEKRWWQDAVAIFTLALVFVGAAQAILFFVQLKFIREGLIGTKEAADAAQGAAKAAEKQARIAETALLSVEIPYLYPFVRRHGFVSETSETTNVAAVVSLDYGNDFIEYYFKNFGRTPAEITEVQAVLLPSRGIPVAPEWGAKNLNPLSGHIVAANGGLSGDFPYAFNNGTFDALAAQVQYNRNTHIFWFIGYVRYNDVFDNEYVRGFCLAYSPMTDDFYPIGGEGYNYRKKTKSAGGAESAK
jgi:hypothetical protein